MLGIYSVRSDVIVKAQFKKIPTQPQVWHHKSTNIVKLANEITNMLNNLTQLGYTSDLVAVAGLSSATYKNFLHNWEKNDYSIWKFVDYWAETWLWFAYKAVIYENLFAQTNCRLTEINFKAPISRRWVSLLQTLMPQAKPRTKKVPSKTDNTPFRLVKSSNQWKQMNDQSISRNSDCFSIVWEEAVCHRTAKTGHVVYLTVKGDTTDFGAAISQKRRLQKTYRMLQRQWQLT